MLNASLENLSTTNYTKPLFRIAWHFWTNTKYSGEVSLIISMDIFIGSWLSVWELYLIIKHMEISLYAQTQQSLLLLTQGNIYTSLEISKQISCVLRGIKRGIPRKLVKISHCRVSSFLKTVPGCRVSRHSVKFKKPFHSQTPESIMDPQSSVLTLEPQFMVPFVLSIGRNEIWTSLLITFWFCQCNLGSERVKHQ